MSEVKRERRGRHREFVGDVSGGSAFRPRLHEQAKHGKTMLVSECAKGFNGGILFHFDYSSIIEQLPWQAPFRWVFQGALRQAPQNHP